MMMDTTARMILFPILYFSQTSVISLINWSSATSPMLRISMLCCRFLHDIDPGLLCSLVLALWEISSFSPKNQDDNYNDFPSRKKLKSNMVIKEGCPDNTPSLLDEDNHFAEEQILSDLKFTFLKKSSISRTYAW